MATHYLGFPLVTLLACLLALEGISRVVFQVHPRQPSSVRGTTAGVPSQQRDQIREALRREVGERLYAQLTVRPPDELLDPSNPHHPLYHLKGDQAAWRPWAMRKVLDQSSQTAARRDPASLRILVFGDSCSQYTPHGPHYPDMVQTLLQHTGLWTRVEVINAGGGGGRATDAIFFTRSQELSRLEPDLVTVYYGWNDHWRFLQDAEINTMNHVRSILRFLYSHSRLMAVLHERTLPARQLLHRWKARREKEKYDYCRLHPELCLEGGASELLRFEKELEELVALFPSNTTFLFITAAAAPALLASWMQSEAMIEHRSAFRHPAFVEAVRRCALRRKALLLDWEAAMQQAPSEAYFSDFVHPNEVGHVLLAQKLRDVIVSARPLRQP